MIVFYFHIEGCRVLRLRKIGNSWITLEVLQESIWSVAGICTEISSSLNGSSPYSFLHSDRHISLQGFLSHCYQSPTKACIEWLFPAINMLRVVKKIYLSDTYFLDNLTFGMTCVSLRRWQAFLFYWMTCMRWTHPAQHVTWDWIVEKGYTEAGRLLISTGYPK